MALLVFDTHDFITELTEAGIDAEHAKAISDGLKRINLDHMATKGDISELKASLLQWFTGMLIGQAALIAALAKLL